MVEQSPAKSGIGAAMTLRNCAFCCGLIALSACASAPPPQPQQQAKVVTPHQDPSNPNPNALPEGVMEWVNYVCNDIPDPEARAQAIKDSAEQKGWVFTCPEDKQTAATAMDSPSAAK
jgi:hypothetical protein